MLTIHIRNEEGQVTSVPFGVDEVTFGREEGSTVRLSDENVSRRHARLVREDDRVFIEDVGARYGTFVNGRRLAHEERVEIEAGDYVQLGDYYVQLEGLPGADLAESEEVPDSEEVAREVSLVLDSLEDPAKADLYDTPDEAPEESAPEEPSPALANDEDEVPAPPVPPIEAHAAASDFEVVSMEGPPGRVEDSASGQEDELLDMSATGGEPDSGSPVVALICLLLLCVAAVWAYLTFFHGGERLEGGAAPAYSAAPATDEGTTPTPAAPAPGPGGAGAIPAVAPNAAPSAAGPARHEGLLTRAREEMSTENWGDAIELLDEARQAFEKAGGSDPAFAGQLAAARKQAEGYRTIAHRLKRARDLLARTEVAEAWEALPAPEQLEEPADNVYRVRYFELRERVQDAEVERLLDDADESLSLGNAAKALELARKAQSMAPDKTRATRTIADAEARLQAAAEAALAGDPPAGATPPTAAADRPRGGRKTAQQDLEDLYREARRAKADGAIYRARDLLAQVVRKKPGFARAHHELALILEVLGERAAAVKHYKRYLALTPDPDDKETVTGTISRLGGTP